MLDPADAVGMRVSVKTSPLGETHEGVIFTYDATTSALILEQRKGAEPKATYRVVKTSVVRAIEVLEIPDPAADSAEKPPLPEVNMAAVRSREERAVARTREDLAGQNRNVTVRAQAIFDALRKTMPCEWLEKEVKGEKAHWIRILHEVLLPPPYTPDLCEGAKGPTLTRVQKVLAGELEKLARTAN